MRLFIDKYGNYSVLNDNEMAVIAYRKLANFDFEDLEQAPDSEKMLVINELTASQNFTWTDVYDTLQEAIRLCEQPATSINQYAIKQALHALKEGLGYNE